MNSQELAEHKVLCREVFALREEKEQVKNELRETRHELSVALILIQHLRTWAHHKFELRSAYVSEDVDLKEALDDWENH